jgi:hypothetical protein
MWGELAPPTPPKVKIVPWCRTGSSLPPSHWDPTHRGPTHRGTPLGFPGPLRPSGFPGPLRRPPKSACAMVGVGRPVSASQPPTQTGTVTE